MFSLETECNKEEIEKAMQHEGKMWRGFRESREYKEEEAPAEHIETQRSFGQRSTEWEIFFIMSTY